MTELRTYHPGDWFAVLGERATVLLPSSEKKRVGVLWELVDDGAGFDEVLDALIASGLRDLPGFVLVSGSESDGVRAVVRGPAVVTLSTGDDDVVLDGAEAATWVERHVEGTTGMTAQVGSAAAGEPAEGQHLSIDGGVVRVSRVAAGSAIAAPATGVATEAEADGAEADGAEQDDPEGDRPPSDGSPSDGPEADLPAAVPVVSEGDPEDEPDLEAQSDLEAEADPVAGTEAESHDDAGFAPEPEAPAAPAPAPEAPAPAPEPPGGAEPAAADAPDYASFPPPTAPPTGGPAVPDAPGPDAVDTPDALDTPPTGTPVADGPGSEAPSWEPASPQAPAPGEEGDGADLPAAPAYGAEEPADSESGDHDGHTRAGMAAPPELARQHPGLPGQPPPPSQVASPVAKLVFSSGEVIDVDRPVLVGRAPEARKFTMTEQPVLVTVPSPHQEISSTHLEVRPGSGADSGTATVTDLGSTNGSVLVQPGLPPEDLQPGIAISLLPGAIIDLGDSVTIQVTQP